VTVGFLIPPSSLVFRETVDGKRRPFVGAVFRLDGSLLRPRARIGFVNSMPTRLRATIAAGLASAVLLTAPTPPGAPPQLRPDFSGEWVLVIDSALARPSVAAVGDAAFRRGDMGSGWGSPLAISQQPNSLTVQFQPFSAYDLNPPIRLVYALDGSESLNGLMLGHSESTVRSRAAWAGDVLVITTHYPAPAGAGGAALATEVRQSLTLDAPTVLRIETTRAGVSAGVSAGAASTTRSTYRKR